MASAARRPKDALFLGIDVGTSGVRAVLINAEQTELCQSNLPLPSPHINDKAIEQEPEIWWNTLSTLLMQLGQQHPLNTLRALAIDGTSGTVLLTDAENNPISPGLMYNDARAESQAAMIAHYAPTSPAAAVSAGLPKILWLLEHCTKTTVTHICHQADWLASRLTGIAGISDTNNCLKTGFDPLTMTWPSWMDTLPIRRHGLPQVYSPGKVIANVAKSRARALGLPDDTVVVAGTTDSHAAVLATGVSKIGDAVTSLGSTLVLKIVCAQPIVDARYGIYSQPFGQHWLVGGASNSGGAVLNHFFAVEQITQLSQQINPDHDTRLNYYPLLRPGERFPVADPHCAPQLSPRPENDVQFLQGLLEGIAQIELRGYRQMQALGAPFPTSVRSIGGGASNLAWSKMRQRYLNVPVMKASHQDAAYGAALLAKRGYDAKYHSQ